MPSPDTDDLFRELTIARQYIADLWQKADQSPQQSPQLLAEALTGFDNFSKKLNLTVEALCRQQEQFLALQELVERALNELEKQVRGETAEPAAPASVETLGELLMICASCKKIRDGQGTWKVIEDYISDRFGVRFSHGFCPECLKKMFPEYREKIPLD